jgi:hypothetical protein
MIKKIKAIDVEIDKLITLAEIGLGVERPLNREKRAWIKKLEKQADDEWKPILVSPIKDTGYYILNDGWHRVQAAKKKKWTTLEALIVPLKVGLGLAKINKMLRDIDQEHGYELGVSSMVNEWSYNKLLDVWCDDL